MTAVLQIANSTVSAIPAAVSLYRIRLTGIDGSQWISLHHEPTPDVSLWAVLIAEWDTGRYDRIAVDQHFENGDVVTDFMQILPPDWIAD